MDRILSQISDDKNTGMKRSLRLRDLTAMGIAAIIGAGIFSTIGTAAVNGGPAVSLLFIFTAVACGFSAMCYAEFASRVPVSGSAYTYAYASFGELIAWIIGWDLIMEYAVGNIAVAISWSGYFVGLMSGLGIYIPEWLCLDYISARNGFNEASILLQQGIPFAEINHHLQNDYLAWSKAPDFLSTKLVLDIPAFTIVVLVTALVFIGINETKKANNIMVLIKLAILIAFIGVGVFYINPDNWSPFAPNGFSGVMKGVAGVFFAYIGFDAISTTAEECKNPQRDLPRSMILALLITTVLYVLISLVLTGMVHFTELGVSDPLAYVFERVGLNKFSGLIAFTAIIAMTGVLLVFQIGQPRIWMSMSRDGLLPPKFSKLHKKYRTPAFATVITGILVAFPTLFMNLEEVTDLTSIGTLFAFTLVSGGILIMGKDELKPGQKGYRIPYINSRYFLPFLWIFIIIAAYFIDRENFISIFSNNYYITNFTHKIPYIIFIISIFPITYFAIKKQWSLIPVIGLLVNFYLMTELGTSNWLRFLIWLAIGLILYFTYGYKNSKLRKG